jgi:uncharacterized protein (DUF58 family)
MIVPTNRLLFWFAAIALPFSALGALYVEAMLLSIALIAAMLVVAVVDAALALGSVDSVSLQLPPLLRFSKERDGVIEVLVKNPSRQARRLRIGLPLPPSIASAQEDVVVTLPAEAEQSRLEWTCRPSCRGNFQLRRGYLESPSRLGFWNVRRTVPVQCELRVYPNLLTERKDLAALFLRRGALGVHAQRQIGKGRDFEKLRDYVPGDSFDEIHWKATARHGRPVTKVFQIERTQEVYVIIDASRLSARKVANEAGNGVASNQYSVISGQKGKAQSRDISSLNTDDCSLNPGTTVLERFLTAALILGQAAEQQGDLFGLLTFSDRVETFLRAKNGKEHYAACRDAIYTLEPRPITPDFDEISSFIRTRLRRRALLVFLTSLDDPVLAESFIRNMALLSGQHLVLVNMIKPPDADPLFSRPDVNELDDIYRHLGGHLQWHSLRELEKVLQRRGVRFSLLANEHLASDLVSQYVGVKQRQLL